MTIGSFLEKNRINDFVKKNNMLEKGDSVVLGLSGGPDSVCLFLVLLQLMEEYSLEIKAVHVNHLIRGKAADEDQAFVEKLCTENSISLDVHRVDIPALVKESGRSIEEEARMARYSIFEETVSRIEKNGGSAKIAIAHNANDNAETVLFHMARGCGLDGVCGIAPVRGKIVRPLLETSKEEILEFLESNNQKYCIDLTNDDVNYDRNRIRHNILPELNRVNERALGHISEMTQLLTEVADYLNEQANGLLLMAKEGDDALRKRTIATAPEVLKKQTLKLFLSKYMPNEKDVSQVHIDKVMSLLNEDGEKWIDLPHKKRLIISYDTIYVVDKDEQVNEVGTFNITEFSYEMGMEYPTNTYTKWFDCDKIAGDIVIRNRMEGDYLVINAEGGRKSIQDYFVDQKIPKSKRDEIMLVCEGSHVLWVVGYRISEYYKITNETTRIMEISYTKE